MRKKIMATILGTAMLLTAVSFTGCGKSVKDSTSAKTEKTTKETKRDEKIEIKILSKYDQIKKLLSKYPKEMTSKEASDQEIVVIENESFDKASKKIWDQFLKDVKEALGLEGLEALHGRAEDLARDKSLRAAFDLCVSRAVANLSVLSEYCIPFVRTNGYFVSYKGKKGLEEISNAQNCMNVLGCKIEKVDDFRLEEDEAERLLIRIKKCKGTPKLYPRKAGTPSKNPL